MKYTQAINRRKNLPSFFAYTRVSTKDQKKKYSLEVQETYLKIIFERDYKNLKWEYVPEAESGKNLEARDIMKSVLNAVGIGDVLGVYDTSRLGRNTIENLEMLDEITRKGARLTIAGKELNPNDPNDRFMLNITSAIAELNRGVQNLKAKAGILVKKGKGEWIFRGTMFGYQVIRGKIEKIKQEETILKQMYEDYSGGMTLRQIANKNKNYITRDGKHLTFASIRRLLIKPIYMGYYPEESSIHGIASLIIKEDSLIKSELYPAIIDKELWWKCYSTFQHVVKKSSRSLHKRYSFYALSTLICCGYCGKTYVHNILSKRGRSMPYYSCRVHIGGCEQKHHNFQCWILEYVFEIAFYIFISKSNEIAKFFDIQRKEYAEKRKQMQAQLTIKESQLKNVDSQIAKLVDSILEFQENQTIKERLKSRANDLEMQRDNAKNEIENIRSEIVKYMEEDDKIKYTDVLLERFMKASEAERRMIYIEIIYHCEVRDGMIIITFFSHRDVVVFLEPKKGSRVQKEFRLKTSYDIKKTISEEVSDIWINVDNHHIKTNDKYMMELLKNVLPKDNELILID